LVAGASAAEGALAAGRVLWRRRLRTQLLSLYKNKKGNKDLCCLLKCFHVRAVCLLKDFLLLYFAAIHIGTFLLCAADKHFARKREEGSPRKPCFYSPCWAARRAFIFPCWFIATKRATGNFYTAFPQSFSVRFSSGSFAADPLIFTDSCNFNKPEFSDLIGG
jgi:hypothetical protein